MGKARLRISTLALERILGAANFRILCACDVQPPRESFAVDVVVESGELQEVQEGADLPMVTCVVQERNSRISD